VKTSDWAFHKIPPDELRAAWNWEIQRTADGRGESWTKLPPALRRKCVEYCRWDKATGLREIALPVDPCRFDAYEDPRAMVSGHLLEIDWHRSRAEIVRAFEKWLGDRPTGRDNGGPRNPKPWLIDLAIYRASIAGLTRPAALKRLAPLFQWAGVAQTEANKFSPSHWVDAKRRTADRLTELRKISFRLSTIFQNT